MTFGVLPNQNLVESENRSRGFMMPTPGTTNTESIKNEVKTVKLSENRGWHDQGFKLKLSTKTSFTPNRLGPFAAQSRELPVPYSFPPITTNGISAA